MPSSTLPTRHKYVLAGGYLAYLTQFEKNSWHRFRNDSPQYAAVRSAQHALDAIDVRSGAGNLYKTATVVEAKQALDAANKAMFEVARKWHKDLKRSRADRNG